MIYDADIEAGIQPPTYKIYESLTLKISAMPVISYDLYMNRQGLDGYVSIEVPPTIAHDTEATIKKPDAIIKKLAGKMMIKIPARRRACLQSSR